MSLETTTQSVLPNTLIATDNVVALKSVTERTVKVLQSTMKKPANYCDDVDDMWDNVPV